MFSFEHGLWGLELWPSCLQDKCFPPGVLSWTPNTLDPVQKVSCWVSHCLNPFWVYCKNILLYLQLGKWRTLKIKVMADSTMGCSGFCECSVDFIRARICLLGPGQVFPSYHIQTLGYNFQNMSAEGISIFTLSHLPPWGMFILTYSPVPTLLGFQWSQVHKNKYFPSLLVCFFSLNFSYSPHSEIIISLSWFSWGSFSLFRYYFLYPNCKYSLGLFHSIVWPGRGSDPFVSKEVIWQQEKQRSLFGLPEAYG